jgi:hypothetical protein
LRLPGVDLLVQSNCRGCTCHILSNFDSLPPNSASGVRSASPNPSESRPARERSQAMAYLPGNPFPAQSVSFSICSEA